LIIAVISLALLLIFVLEFPSAVLILANSQLKEQGISYGDVEGGLLSGVRLTDVNYQNKVKVKNLDLKVDWERLEDKILYIDYLKVEDIEIDSEYLSSLIYENRTKKSDDSNTTIPLEQIIVNRADISLKNIIYDAYKVNHASLEIRDLSTNMREQYKGNVRLRLDSNVTQLALDGSIKNEFVKLIANIEPNREFVNPFISDNNITLINNPIFKIKADGNMTKVKYHLDVQRLGVKQNEYKVDSKKLILFGNYNIPQKNLKATIKTELKGSMAYLKLDGDTTLNLDDLNNTLNYKLDTTINPKKSFLTQTLAEQNITFFKSPTIKLKSFGSMKNLKYNLTLKDINLKQNDYKLQSNDFLLYGDYSLLKKDLKATIKTKIRGNMAYLKLNGDTTLNLDDLNNTLNYKLDTTINPKKRFLTKTLAEQNVTFFKSPTVKLKSSGSMKNLKYNLTLKDINLKQNDYKLQSDNFLLYGSYSLLKKDLKANIKTNINSNIALIDLDAETKFDLDDLNNTLEFKLLSKISPKKEFVESKITDSNISLDSIQDIDIVANGTLKKSKFKVDFHGLSIKKDDIDFELLSLLLKGNTNPLRGDTSVDIA
jgi:type III secretory pathway component EscR